MLLQSVGVCSADRTRKLNPGGWIEQIENEIGFRSDDNTIRAHSVLYSDYRNFSLEFAERMGRPLDTYHRFRSRIESAGFVNVHEMRYKVPVGVWTRNQMFKEAGFHNQEQLIKGVEGYMIYPFTQFGHWSVNDTRKFIEECKKELAKDEIHKYYFTRRIWAQKPLWSPK